MTNPAARAVEPAPPTDPRVVAFARLVGVVDRLRAPDGCPWDKKQTVQSMAPHLIEESHEALEAIETHDDEHTAEELGDVLMVVVLICKIGEQEGRFDLTRAAHAISDKLIHRHPHVFGEVTVESAEQVLVNWEAIKKAEREGKQQDASAVAGVPGALPALQRAQRVCGKAVSAGFKWPSVAGALNKVHEETRELDQALREAGLDHDAHAPASSEQRARVEHELGDVLLAGAFLAKYLDLDAEKTCRDAVRRFERRFREMERSIGGVIAGQPLDELMRAWEAAKRAV